MTIKNNLKISIVTIVRNGMPFVKETVESVLSQDYESLEYIVVDAVSTDGTVEFLLENKTRLSKLIIEKDDGIADAFNKGLNQVSGDYIMFLNADDSLASPCVISEMVKSIISFNKPMIIYGDCELLDRNTSKAIARTVINFNVSELINGLMIPHPSTLTSKKYFAKYGIFDTSFTIAMDYEWFLRGANKEKIIHIKKLITLVREGGVSTKNQVKVISEIVRALKKNSYIKTRLMVLIIYMKFISRFMVRVLLQFFGLYGLYKTYKNPS
jgi:glycosyltransferase involved in cell wall biosynthesis